jgi:RNA polymerase sigma factor (sigma-70 family)
VAPDKTDILAAMFSRADDPIAAGEERSDGQLLADVRAGNEFAYGVLWRRHQKAAHSFARTLVGPSDVDELVSESFYRVLRAIGQGGGPDGGFRPYLFTTIRRAQIDLGRRYHNRVTLTDDARDLEVEHEPSAADEVLHRHQNSAAWRAWASLPEETRTLLWHSIIEEESPAQLAPMLGISPNSVASRTVRAREKLRQAFLAQHVRDADNEQCRYARERLGRYARNALSERERAIVEEHLEQCGRCSTAFAEIRDLNFAMRAGIAPILLGGVAAARYLGRPHRGWASRVRRPISNGARGPLVAAGVAASVAAVIVVITQVADRSATRPEAAAASPSSRLNQSQLPAIAHAATTAPRSGPHTTPGAVPVLTRASRPHMRPASSTTSASGGTPTNKGVAGGGPSQSSQPSAPSTPSRARSTSEASSPSSSGSRTSGATASWPRTTTTTTTISIALTGTGFIPGSLTVTTDQPWTITSMSGPAGAICSVISGREAACWLASPNPSTQTFRVAVLGPSGRPGTAHAAYDPLSGSSTSKDYPI